MSRAASFQARLVGVPSFQHALALAPERVKRALGSGLYLVGNNVMTASKAIVPVKWGVLKGSGYVTPPKEDGQGVFVELGYGGPAQAYAVRIHETPYEHGKHDCGGGWKYLEKPMQQARPSFMRDVGRFAARHFERGGFGPGKGPHPKTPNEGPTEKAA